MNKLQRKQRKQKKREENNRKRSEYKEQLKNGPRKCGECRACCFVFALLDKPEKTWCKHSTKSGCACYEGRPPVCRDYVCEWLYNRDWPQCTRPDKSGLVVTYRGKYNGIPIMVVTEVWPDAAKSATGREIIETLKDNGIFIVVEGVKGRMVFCRHLGVHSQERAEEVAEFLRANKDAAMQEDRQVPFDFI
jgi:hypothetical protein